MNKNHLSEDDISIKFIILALHKAGWDEEIQTSLTYHLHTIVIL